MMVCDCLEPIVQATEKLSKSLNPKDVFKRFYLFIFRERGREGERGEKHMWLPLMRPQLGIWPATQACALTGNKTSDPVVSRPMLNPLSYTSQGPNMFFNSHTFGIGHAKCFRACFGFFLGFVLTPDWTLSIL